MCDLALVVFGLVGCIASIIVSVLVNTFCFCWEIRVLEVAIDNDFTTSARYSTLCITSDVNIIWNPSTGEFKFSGSYGVPRSV